MSSSNFFFVLIMVSHFPVKLKIEAKDVTFCSAHKCMLMTTVVFIPALTLFWLFGSFRIFLRTQFFTF